MLSFFFVNNKIVLSILLLLLCLPPRSIIVVGLSLQQQQQQQRSNDNNNNAAAASRATGGSNTNSNANLGVTAATATAQQRRRDSLNVGHHPLLSLNMNLDALARQDAPERAQELYQRISALYKEGYYAVSPDVVSFNSVLKAWSKGEGETLDPIRTLDFWNQESENTLFQPNVRSYNTFLLVLARCGLSRQCETLFRQMQDKNSLVYPDSITYNTLLLAYTFTKDQDAPSRASAILEEMLDPNSYVRPDVVSFNTVLAALSKSKTKAAAQKAQDCFHSIEKHGILPDVYSYTTTIQAWAQCGESSKALSLLRHMQQQQEKFPHLQPNKVTYTVVMQALLRDRKPEVAQELLNEMLELSTKFPQMHPDVVTFSALIDGYARNQAADRQPRETIRIVVEVLDRMKEMAKEWPDVAPNQQTYTSVLSALAKSRQWESGPLAEQHLREMNERGVPPSVIHWNAVLNAYAKSPRANKVTCARRIWDSMKTLSTSSSKNSAAVAPDVITYNTLLSVAANSFGEDDTIRKSSLQMGFEVFRAVQQDRDCHATSLTFHYLFKVIRKFMPHSKKRWDIVHRIFDLCCQQGCLNNLILEQITEQMALSDEEIGTLLGGDNWMGSTSTISVSSLPSEWSENSLPSKKGSWCATRK